MNIKDVFTYEITIDDIKESQTKKGKVIDDVKVIGRGKKAIVQIPIEFEGEPFILKATEDICVELSKKGGFETKEWIGKTVYLSVVENPDNEEEEVFASFRRLA